MRCLLPRFAALLLLLPFTASAEESFRWIDFHAPTSSPEQNIVAWVDRSLASAHWTALREIGVYYDAALVVTAERSSPQAFPDADRMTVWSTSLTEHRLTPLVSGCNLHWIDWIELREGRAAEPVLVYDDCQGGSSSSFLTSFVFNPAHHEWSARWMRGDKAIPISNPNPPAGVEWSQLYALLPALDGSRYVATWSHIGYGSARPAEDYLYRYDLDPASGLDRMLLVSGAAADSLRLTLCRAPQNAAAALCQPLVAASSGRRPVTTPPAHNQGRSTPPRSHR